MRCGGIVRAQILKGGTPPETPFGSWDPHISLQENIRRGYPTGEFRISGSEGENLDAKLCEGDRNYATEFAEFAKTILRTVAGNQSPLLRVLIPSAFNCRAIAS